MKEASFTQLFSQQTRLGFHKSMDVRFGQIDLTSVQVLLVSFVFMYVLCFFFGVNNSRP